MCVQMISICEIGSMIGAVEEDIVRFKVHIKSKWLIESISDEGWNDETINLGKRASIDIHGINDPLSWKVLKLEDLSDEKQDSYIVYEDDPKAGVLAKHYSTLEVIRKNMRCHWASFWAKKPNHISTTVSGTRVILFDNKKIEIINMMVYVIMIFSIDHKFNLRSTSLI
ncbi:hypothetical protein ACJX0J_018879 [Zea mays]